MASCQRAGFIHTASTAFPQLFHRVIHILPKNPVRGRVFGPGANRNRMGRYDLTFDGEDYLQAIIDTEAKNVAAKYSEFCQNSFRNYDCETVSGSDDGYIMRHRWVPRIGLVWVV